MKKQHVISCLIFLSLLKFGCSYESTGNGNSKPIKNYNKSISLKSKLTDTNGSHENIAKFTNPQNALRKGNEFLQKNQIEKAIEAFKKAVELKPDLAFAHLKLGIAYSLKEKENRLKPQSGNNLNSIKRNSKKALKNAVNAFKKIVRENPNDDTAFYNLGRTYAKLFEDRESERAFRRAVRLKPNDGEYQTELGAALIKLAKYSEALRALNKALEIDRENFRAEDLLKKAKKGYKRINFRPKSNIDQEVKKEEGKNKYTTKEKPTENNVNSE